MTEHMSRFHSGYFNDTLRCWQCANTEIGAHNLMLPIFILYVCAFYFK